MKFQQRFPTLHTSVHFIQIPQCQSLLSTHHTMMIDTDAIDSSEGTAGLALGVGLVLGARGGVSAQRLVVLAVVNAALALLACAVCVPGSLCKQEQQQTSAYGSLFVQRVK